MIIIIIIIMTRMMRRMMIRMKKVVVEKNTYGRISGPGNSNRPDPNEKVWATAQTQKLQIDERWWVVVVEEC